MTPETAARIGYLAGQGYSFRSIAEQVGLPAHTVYDVCSRWGVKGSQTEPALFVFPLASLDRARLSKQAARQQIAPSEFLRRILVYALRDNLYKAIVDE